LEIIAVKIMEGQAKYAKDEKVKLFKHYTLMHKSYRMQINSKFDRCANRME